MTQLLALIVEFEKEIQSYRSVKRYKLVHVVRAALSLGPSWACLVPNCQWLENF